MPKPIVLWLDNNVEQFYGTFLEALQEAGYDVRVARSIAQALALLRAPDVRYDLLLWEWWGIPVGGEGISVSDRRSLDALGPRSLEAGVYGLFKRLFPRGRTCLLSTSSSAAASWRENHGPLAAFCKRELPSGLVAHLSRLMSEPV